METAAETPDRSSDLLWGALVSGAYASAATALLFLLIDGLRGQALYTASLLGSVVLLGQDPASAGGVFRLDIVALYSLVHLAAFVVVGAVATRLCLRWSFLRQPFLLMALLTLSLTAGVVAVDAVLYPGIVTALGEFEILAGNAAAAAAMTWVLRSDVVSAGRERARS